MKGTGIIRRVDDLGRVVIAKNIRQQLKIKEGEPMEFFIDGESIVLRKYKPYDVDNCENATYNCDACVKNGDCAEQCIVGRPRWEEENG